MYRIDRPLSERDVLVENGTRLLYPFPWVRPLSGWAECFGEQLHADAICLGSALTILTPDCGFDQS
jgi:hypothetical protein